MTKIFKFGVLVLCGMLPVRGFQLDAQDRTHGFTIDHSRPYVYLKFDHVGNRKPISRHEPGKGLWIRLVNNCQVPIIVGTFDLETGDPGLGVYDEVVPVDLNAPPLGHGVRPGESLPSTREEQKESIPEGYSAGDVVTTTTVAPGASLLLSLPANHVGPSWKLQIQFYLAPPGTNYGDGPYSVLSFGWHDVPDKLRAALRP
jgi:hypothetical protein